MLAAGSGSTTMGLLCPESAGACLGHEQFNASNAQQGVDELLAHALEQVRVADLPQVQVPEDAPPDGGRKDHQHLQEQPL